MKDRAANDGIVLICHWPDGQAYWLEDALVEEGFSVTRFSAPWGQSSGGLLASRLQTFSLGWRAARFAASRGVAIVADSDGHDAGVCAAIASLLFCRSHRPVLCINLIFWDRVGLRSRLRRFLYRLALSNPETTFTVSTNQLREHYTDLLRTRAERFVVLPDCYTPGHRGFRQHDTADDGGYVFVGGDAVRDWETAIAVAEACSSVPFLFAAFKRHWPDLAVPPNVKLTFDLSLDDFIEAFRNCRMSLVLLTDATVTAGLNVVKYGALMGSLVLSTRTPATQRYYPPQCKDLLVPMSDPATVAQRIGEYWDDQDARSEAAASFQKHVLDNHSPEAYVQTIAAHLRAGIECDALD
jgi:hypothetical protein